MADDDDVQVFASIYTATRRCSKPSRKFLIQFQFSGTSRFYRRVAGQDLALLRSNDDDHPLPEISITTTVDEFSRNDETMKRSIGEKLHERWPLSDEGRRGLIEMAMEWTQEAITHMSSTGENVLRICFRVDVAVEEAVRGVDWGIRGSMDDHVDEGFMVPALESSIEGVMGSKKTISAGCRGDGACAVCLEELSTGGEAVFMPCSHVFHGDCIGKWLRTSHYCPVCRFKMPTN